MDSIQDAVSEYRKFLKEMQETHTRQIAEANAQLERLLAGADNATANKDTAVKPQSVWVTGNDGERFLMLNQQAVDQIDALFENFKEVVALLARREKGQ